MWCYIYIIYSHFCCCLETKTRRCHRLDNHWPMSEYIYKKTFTVFDFYLSCGLLECDSMPTFRRAKTNLCACKGVPISSIPETRPYHFIINCTNFPRLMIWFRILSFLMRNLFLGHYIVWKLTVLLTFRKSSLHLHYNDVVSGYSLHSEYVES